MKAIVVNADELGFTEPINRAIIESHTSGIVTSTTMMVNMYAFEHGVMLAKENPNLGVGLHLNLTYGRPLLSVNSVSSLVDTSGTFLSRRELVKRLVLKRVVLSEVENELQAQLAKFKNSGMLLSHFDSHQNIHLFPQIFPIYLKLAAETGVPVRLARDPLVTFKRDASYFYRYIRPFTSRTFLKQRVPRWCFYRNYRKQISLHRVKMADHFLSLSSIHPAESRKNVLEQYALLLKSAKEGYTEIMCHPGYVNEELVEHSSLVWERQKELKALTHPALKTIIKERGIQLITFHDIPPLSMGRKR